QADHWKDQPGAEAAKYAAQLAVLGQDLLRQGKFADAEPLLRACLAIRARIEPDAWTTFFTQAQLGASLLAQRKYAEAEPLLVQGCEGLKQRRGQLPSPAYLTGALARLVHLCEATGQKDRAEKYRQQLEQAKKPGP